MNTFIDAFVKEKVEYDAKLFFFKEDLPELRRASFVIMDRGDNISVGVKAFCLIPAMDEKNNFLATNEMFGNYMVISKSETLSQTLDHIKELVENVSGQIQEAKDAAKAKLLHKENN